MAPMQELRLDQTLAGASEYDCHTIDQQQAWRFPPHLHVDCCDLTYVHRGTLEQEINGVRSVVREGMMTLVRPGEVHRVWSRGLVMFNLNFHPESLRRAAAYLGEDRRIDALLAREVAPILDTRIVHRSGLLLEYQNLLYGQRTPGATAAFRAFLVRWIHEILEDPGSAADSSQPSWLSDLLDFLDENAELPVRVADLRRMSGRSAEHIARCFRTHLGITPSAAINAARLKRAALLLAHSNRDILDICYSLGFNSASYFYRLFGARYGMTPRGYRRENSALHLSSDPEPSLP